MSIFGNPHRSHLGNNTAQDVDRRQAGGDIHGASQVHAVPAGGSHVVGVPDKHVNAVGLPVEAQNWEGSSTIYGVRELPAGGREFLGDAINGLAGSASVVSEEELCRREGRRYPRPPPKAPTPSQLAPGAYRRQDGNILLVNAAGQQQVVTPQVYQQMKAQAEQQRSGGIVGAVMRKIRGG